MITVTLDCHGFPTPSSSSPRQQEQVALCPFCRNESHNAPTSSKSSRSVGTAIPSTLPSPLSEHIFTGERGAVEEPGPQRGQVVRGRQWAARREQRVEVILTLSLFVSSLGIQGCTQACKSHPSLKQDQGPALRRRPLF